MYNCITFLSCVSDTLLRQVTAMQEEMNTLRGTVSELDQHRVSLQEQLEKKTDLLSTAHDQLDEKVLPLHSHTKTHIFGCILDLLA